MEIKGTQIQVNGRDYLVESFERVGRGYFCRIRNGNESYLFQVYGNNGSLKIQAFLGVGSVKDRIESIKEGLVKILSNKTNLNWILLKLIRKY